MKRAILLVALLGASSPAAAQQPAPQTMPINYVDAELADVIRSLAAALGVNVMLTDVPSRRITFQTPQPIPIAEVGAVLEAILESQGLIMVQSGPVAQVMLEEKKPATGPVRVGKEFPSPPPLGLVTQIVPLEYIQAEEGVTLLRQVASKSARIEVVARSNAILITDRGGSVARYVDLLVKLDVKTGGEAGLRTYVYPLKHASAPELAATLGQLFGSALSGGAAGRQRVEALAAASLSEDLRSMRQREVASFQQPGVLPQAAVAPRLASDTVQAEVRGLVGRTAIVPDQATNSLVIRTAPPNFALLLETIEQLDVRPPQVLLEVLIVEVTLDRSSEWGINWQVLTSGDTTRGATIGFGPQSFGDAQVANPQGLGIRLVRLASMDVRAIIKAVAAKTNVRVLSTPRILALNNEQARILVGSAVPFTSSTLTGLNALVNQVVQFRNVGTQLTVIPTINNDGYVTFRLLQEVSALSAQTIASAQNAPVITTREAETSAIVKTGHTVVIGGLIGESEEVTESGVPLLKDIPLLGFLFKSRRVARSRTEIAIFLTPSVVYTDEEADSLFQVQRKQLQESKGKIDSVMRAKTDSLPRARIDSLPRAKINSLLRPKIDSLPRPKIDSVPRPARPPRAEPPQQQRDAPLP